MSYLSVLKNALKIPRS